MREIKFRAWDTNHNVWARYAGFENFEPDGENYPYEVIWQSNGVEHKLLDTKNLVWQQYTGLKDKNGKEIYEGDVFDAWDGRSKYAVEWMEKHACFKLVWVSGDIGDSKTRHYFDMLMAEYQFEPSGNIYENPELLK